MRLNDIPKNEQVFSTPEGYFDALPQKVARRVRKPAPAHASFLSSLRLAYVIPAMAVLIAIGVGVYRWQMPGEPQKFGSVEEILIENDISEMELLDYYTTETDENSDAVTVDEILYDLSEEEVEALIQ